MGVRTPPWEGAIVRGKKCLIVKCRDTLQSLCENASANPDSVWVVGLDGPHESCVRWKSRGAEGRCHGNHFGWQFAITGFVGYDFGFVIASNTLFDSRGEFSGSSYPMKT